MGYFDNSRKRSVRRTHRELQAEKSLASAGPNLPLLDGVPPDLESGSQIINVEGENPKLAVVVGEQTFETELYPEGGGQTVLVGFSQEYCGTVDPEGDLWKIQDGRPLMRAEYPEAYALWGTSFNTGGETTAQFRIPDRRGRVGVGAGNGPGLSNRTLGERGGAQTHTLSVAELASHGHLITVDDDTHWHTITGTSHAHGFPGNEEWANDLRWNYNESEIQDGSSYGLDWDYWTNPDTDATASGGTISSDTHGHPAGASSNGSNTAHNNMQPFLVYSYLVRVRP